jgi:hypothetical protein
MIANGGPDHFEVVELICGDLHSLSLPPHQLLQLCQVPHAFQNLHLCLEHRPQLGLGHPQLVPLEPKSYISYQLYAMCASHKHI